MSVIITVAAGRAGTVTCPNPTGLPDKSLPDIISDLPEISVNIETSIDLSNRMCGITEVGRRLALRQATGGSSSGGCSEVALRFESCT